MNNHWFIQPFRSLGGHTNHTILCQNRTDVIENERREKEAAEILFLELSLNRFPDDGEDEVHFIYTVEDPLEC